MFQKLINKLRTINAPWRTKIFVGYDLDGNMYFEEPKIKRGINFPRRSVIYHDGRSQFYQYDPDSIPVQWQSWMRHTRQYPPTIEELQQDFKRRLETEQKVKELEQKDSQTVVEAIESWNPKATPGAR